MTAQDGSGRVRRYEGFGLAYASTGDYVLHEDYATLEQERDGLAARVRELEAALRRLIRGYTSTLETGRDRIISLGGSCDSLDTMVLGDPSLHAAREAMRRAGGEEA